jgi:hypothetical protein
MSLASQVWKPISIHDVVAEFLLSERHKVAPLISSADLAVIDTPDTKHPYQNHFRLRALLCVRRQLICEIPPDTEWFEVHNLGTAELDELIVIGRCGWDDPTGADRNELVNVAKRRPSVLRSKPTAWRKLILWGHGRNGPFTIMEGNNRLTAYVAEGCPDNLCIPVMIGLSPTPCVFHLPDPPLVLANDLWK